jgi:hypothetical protein
MTSSPDRSGPGQSGATAGQSYFDERMPGAMTYPTESMPQGSRSTMEERLPIERPAPSDDDLRAQIVAALANDAIDVRVHAGKVTLTGAIDGDDAKRELEAEVRGVAGVTAIDNQLGVRR